MKNTNKINAETVTAKNVSNLNKAMNQQFRTLTGCIREFCALMPVLDNESKETAQIIGIKTGANSTERAKINNIVFNNTPYYYMLDGVRTPAEKRTKKDSEGNKIEFYVPRERWTFKKVTEAILVSVGKKEAKEVVVAQ